MSSLPGWGLVLIRFVDWQRQSINKQHISTKVAIYFHVVLFCRQKLQKMPPKAKKSATKQICGGNNAYPKPRRAYIPAGRRGYIRARGK